MPSDTLTQVDTLCQYLIMATDLKLTLEQILPDARYSELHTLVIDESIDVVWPHCLDVTAAEIRLLGPLMKLRGLPSRLLGKKAPGASGAGSFIDDFGSNGFTILRRDIEPEHGQASIIFGAAGKFWSVTNNSPLGFNSPEEFMAFDRPGYAVTVARLDAIDQGDGTTRIETETLIHGTDSASTVRFAPYWAVIRLPSGAIRRSWLAAIKRRVTQ